MIEFLKNMVWWHWLVLAIVLAAAETVMPGAVAIWFAVSAAVIGLLLVVVPLPWQWQLIMFAVLGLVAMLAYRSYTKKHPESTEQPNLNLRGQQHVGSEYTLVEPILQGFGKVRIGDTVWKVSGSDAPVGARVRVTGVDGAVLRVTALP
jgi:membrane protein implicated in regulation of membrane protease activity